MIELARLRADANRLGFCAVGAAEALPGGEGEHLSAFVEQGRHAGMAWMARDAARRADPRRVVAGARSVIVLAAAYGGEDGTIARYARRPDYHEVLLPGVEAVAAALDDDEARAYVDTGPVMEKVWGVRAGIGWLGRQSHLVSRDHGCWLLLGVIVTRAEVETSAPARDLCGRCRLCVDACPTGAVTFEGGGPPRFDARLCRSYLTIEHRGAIPVERRPGMGTGLFGCDLCLNACPWNRFAGRAEHPGLAATLPATVDPAELLAMDGSAFRRRFAGTPVLRARRRGLLRNAAIALGNAGDPGAAASLEGCVSEEEDPVVREAASWALARLATRRT